MRRKEKISKDTDYRIYNNAISKGLKSPGRHHFNKSTAVVAAQALEKLSKQVISLEKDIRGKSYNDLFPEQIADDIKLINSWIKAIANSLNGELKNCNYKSKK